MNTINNFCLKMLLNVNNYAFDLYLMAISKN